MLCRKLRTFFSLVREGRGKDLFHASIGPIVRIIPYKLAELDLDGYFPRPYTSRVPLVCRPAIEADVKRMFDRWPDSQEEYERHHQVYYSWGFKKCLLFFNRNTNDLVHFVFLLTYQDIGAIKRHLPMSIYGYLKNGSDAFMEWAYTFQKYRMKGIFPSTIDFIVQHCKKEGIRKIITHMGSSNVHSVRMTEKTGFSHLADIYQLQFFNQKRHEGLYLVKPHRRSDSRPMTIEASPETAMRK